MARERVRWRFGLRETASEFVACGVGADATIGDQSNSRLEGDAMDVQFITSVAVITPEPAVSRRLYVDRLACH